MDRTVKIQLHPTPEQAQALTETLEQFTRAFNSVIAYGWEHKERNGVKLHHATYRDLKTVCPELVSDLLIQARVKATETVKSALTWQAKNSADYPKRVEKARKKNKPIPKFKPVKCPHSKLCPVRYNQKTYVFNWEKHEVRLSTTQGRISIPFRVPSYSSKYYGYPVATADLCYRHGTFWLHVVISVPEPTTAKSPEVIGVDLGLNRPAVTSNRHFLGSRHWKEIDRRRFRLKRKLQSKGTKSAKHRLRKLKGKALRFHRDCDHVLSKRIVQHTPQGSTIVLENLKHIRESSKIGKSKENDTKRRLHSWSFAQFHSFLSYKAQEQGMRVVKVDPRHTSQTCSRCGYQHRSNRRSQSLFKCRHCGYSCNADFNASLNIRNKYVASLALLGISLESGLPSSNLSSQSSD